MAVAHAYRGRHAAPAAYAWYACVNGSAQATAALLELELHTLQALDATLAGASCATSPRACSVRTPQPAGTATAACAPRCAAWCGAAMR